MHWPNWRATTQAHIYVLFYTDLILYIFMYVCVYMLVKASRRYSNLCAQPVGHADFG